MSGFGEGETGGGVGGQLAVGLFAKCHFEPVDGDRVLAAVHVKHVVFVVDLKDLERPIIGRCSRPRGASWLTYT